VLPSVEELLDGALGFAVPLVTRFRGTDVREGLLIRGRAGWGEFAPFPEYGPKESSRWLAAAIEAAWIGWPSPARDSVPVNAIVPAVDPQRAAALVRASGCSSVKVKVAEPGQTLDDDVARVGAVRDALGRDGSVRVDANGAWTVEQASRALGVLAEFGLEYVEQPCATVEECARLRRRCGVAVAVDEGVRKAPDPRHVRGLRDAADVLVLKVAPLGGVRPALDVAEVYGLPSVVSSALDTSVGLGAGLALAAALPELPYACGLGSGLLLKNDLVTDRLLPVGGQLEVRPVTVDERAAAAVALEPSRMGAWRERLAAAYRQLTDPEDLG
jgi:o-succinylbenzoate synthase